MFSSFAVTASDHLRINNANLELTIGRLDRNETIKTGDSGLTDQQRVAFIEL